MKRPNRTAWIAGFAALTVSLALAACDLKPANGKTHTTLFIGIDASGSFRGSGYYDDALSFLAHYIYGHLNELDGLEKPRELFVGSIGGRAMNEPKAFHPIQDFEGKDIAQIEGDLRGWFPPTDTLTDFNAFIQQVARISKERNLILAPITVMIVSDGIPDLGAAAKTDPIDLYKTIDLSPIEYLSKNVTLRLAYASPKVGDHWRKYVPRQRVRLWTVEGEVMKGWSAQVQPDADPAKQERLWQWVKDNMDFRVRARTI
ncbi:MAG TPA: hypothetical protein VLY20_05440 [Nitrospiria bacterium]|nr:hypothetical protein [Nitrospiria bacterium]